MLPNAATNTEDFQAGAQNFVLAFLFISSREAIACAGTCTACSVGASRARAAGAGALLVPQPLWWPWEDGRLSLPTARWKIRERGLPTEKTQLCNLIEIARWCDSFAYF